MNELLILVALWCGQPMNKTVAATPNAAFYEGREFTEGQSITTAQIQTCRSKILACQDGKTVARLACFQ